MEGIENFVDIRGLNKTLVLMQLYNEAKAEGENKTISFEEASELLKDKNGEIRYIDYIKGKHLWVSLRGNEFYSYLYNMYNGVGLAEKVISDIRLAVEKGEFKEYQPEDEVNTIIVPEIQTIQSKKSNWETRVRQIVSLIVILILLGSVFTNITLRLLYPTDIASMYYYPGIAQVIHPVCNNINIGEENVYTTPVPPLKHDSFGFNYAPVMLKPGQTVEYSTAWYYIGNASGIIGYQEADKPEIHTLSNDTDSLKLVKVLSGDDTNNLKFYTIKWRNSCYGLVKHPINPYPAYCSDISNPFHTQDQGDTLFSPQDKSGWVGEVTLLPGHSYLLYGRNISSEVKFQVKAYYYIYTNTGKSPQKFFVEFHHGMAFSLPNNEVDRYITYDTTCYQYNLKEMFG